MFIPSITSELSATWLTDVLRKNGTLRNARVIELKCTSLDGKQGITGQLARLHLVYDIKEANAPLSIIVKFPTRDLQELEVMFSITFHYEREVRFYQRLAEQTDVLLPKCYYSDINVKDRKYILILEDVSDALCGSWNKGCSIDVARAAIQNISHLHANWWESSKFACMNWLPQWGDAQFSQLQLMYQQGWTSFVEKMADNLPKEFMPIGELLGEQVGEIMAQMQSAPRTLCHFDYQLDNIFVRSKVETCSIITFDWQLVTIGKGTFDVGYFLAGNVSVNDRREHELDLIKMYHQTLIERGIKDYTFEQCWDDYRLSMLYSIARFIIVIGTGAVQGQQQIDYCQNIVPRFVSAAIELLSGALLEPRNGKSL